VTGEGGPGAGAGRGPPGGVRDSRKRPHAAIAASLFFLQGYLIQVSGVSAPFVAKTFDLDDSGVALLLAAVSIGVLGTPLLARLADRFGRRRMLRAALLMLPLPAAATAVAESTLVYAAFQIATVALTGVLALTLQVMVTEEEADRERAGAHGLAGLCLAIGAGLAFVVAPVFEARSDAPWRGMWILASIWSLVMAAASRALPETRRWQAAQRRMGLASRARDLLSPEYRRRTLGVLSVCLVWQLGATATSTWVYYHPVRTLGVEPLTATLLLMGVGPIGLLGFRWGTTLANGLGRRGTFALALCVWALGFVGFYSAVRVPEAWLLPWLGTTFVVGLLGHNAATVAFRTAGGELFPTRLRATMLGWVTAVDAGTATLSHFAVGALAGGVGGLGPSVCLLAVFSLSAIGVWLMTVPETAGIALEAASLDDREPPEPEAFAVVGGGREVEP